ncbi:MAG: hypothetical protein DRN27_09540 [Thermoplasmata archaeon]|nr:MAG: hypothetical protein DRN27_09540 [Thermoplasmata archaeon]
MIFMGDEVQTALEKLDIHVDNGNISKRNSILINNYISRLQAVGHRKGTYSNKRLRKIIYSLISMSQMINVDFDKAKQLDIESLVGLIRRRYKGDTPRDYIVMLRMFIRYIDDPKGEKYEYNEYPPIIKGINTGVRYKTEVQRADIFDKDEIKKLINSTDNLRDRCFVTLLYESGCRISELIGDSDHTGLLLKHVKFDENGCFIDVSGKTGHRNLRIIASSPTISNWMSIHPKKTDNNAPVFCRIYKRKGERISYEYWNKLLRRLGKKVDINKPLNPHNFRHTRLTHLAQQGLNESQLNTFAGWEQGSRQASVYIHLVGADLDEKLLSLQGIKKKKSTTDEFIINVCPRCNHINDPASKYCVKCQQGLSDELVKEYIEKRQTAEQKLGKLDRFLELQKRYHYLTNKSQKDLSEDEKKKINRELGDINSELLDF